MQDITRKLWIDAPIETVWSYLADPVKLGRWLMRVDGPLKAGERFRFVYDATKIQCGDGEVACRVTEMTPPRRFVFNWTFTEIAGVDTLVAIDLAPVNGGTDLTLTHSGWGAVAEPVRAEQVESHSDGWTEHLAIMEELIMGKSVIGWEDRMLAALKAS
ncbi:SRPBCC family protein [Pseudokordiimonas caeni]|uniref:SRPBCC family protein n=1 Tax=Pseudokordiimonas caeni TaxID=2997908 RepID=UPI0028117FFF|nr:SRPBCC domain-containing protein [Pseudokordiimonas caeni]